MVALAEHYRAADSGWLEVPVSARHRRLSPTGITGWESMGRSVSCMPGGMRRGRIRGASLGRRLAHGLLAFALPPVLFAYIVSRVWQSGAPRGELGRWLVVVAFLVA